MRAKIADTISDLLRLVVEHGDDGYETNTVLFHRVLIKHRYRNAEVNRLGGKPYMPQHVSYWTVGYTSHACSPLHGGSAERRIWRWMIQYGGTVPNSAGTLHILFTVRRLFGAEAR